MRVSYSTAFSLYTELALSRPINDWKPGDFVIEAQRLLSAVGWELYELQQHSHKRLYKRWKVNVRKSQA